MFGNLTSVRDKGWGGSYILCGSVRQCLCRAFYWPMAMRHVGNFISALVALLLGHVKWRMGSWRVESVGIRTVLELWRRGKRRAGSAWQLEGKMGIGRKNEGVIVIWTLCFSCLLGSLSLGWAGPQLLCFYLAHYHFDFTEAQIFPTRQDNLSGGEILEFRLSSTSSVITKNTWDPDIQVYQNWTMCGSRMKEKIYQLSLNFSDVIVQ